MNEYVFKTPDLGEGIVEVELLKWYVGPGEEVSKDQPIADVMTDKANVELTAPVSGRVTRLGCAVDESIAVGAELIVFDLEAANVQTTAEVQKNGGVTDVTVVASKSTGEGSVADSASPDSTKEPPAKTEKPPTPLRATARLEHRYDSPESTGVSARSQPQQDSIRIRSAAGGPVLASPAVRRRARELGIDLALIAGSGSAGQVTADDLHRFQQLAASQVHPPRKSLSQHKVTGVRRLIAQKLQQAKRSIPHFSYVEEIELDELERLRQYLNAQRREDQPKLTLLPFIMQAMVLVIEQFPDINATYDDDQDILTRYAGVHIGIATQTDQGLKVPVIRHAESMDIWQKAAAVKRLSTQARDKRISVQDLSGSSITLTSLGKLGGIASTPIINKPEVAIIGVNRAEQRVVVRGGKKKIRTMMNLSSSFDHRIIDGYHAAEFIQAIKNRLEHPVTLFIGD